MVMFCGCYKDTTYSRLCFAKKTIWALIVKSMPCICLMFQDLHAGLGAAAHEQTTWFIRYSLTTLEYLSSVLTSQANSIRSRLLEKALTAGSGTLVLLDECN
jgi:hypothetical protein